MATLLIFLLFLAVYLVILGTVTMLVAWLISGHRASIWSAIKANIFWVITLILMIIGASQSIDALRAQLPWQVMLPLSAIFIILGAIVIPCWVFARHLEINTLQAFAVLLLLSVISSVTGAILGALVESRLPDDIRARMHQKTQLTQTHNAVVIANHV